MSNFICVILMTHLFIICFLQWKKDKKHFFQNDDAEERKKCAEMNIFYLSFIFFVQAFHNLVMIHYENIVRSPASIFHMLLVLIREGTWKRRKIVTQNSSHFSLTIVIVLRIWIIIKMQWHSFYHLAYFYEVKWSNKKKIPLVLDTNFDLI